MGCILPIVSLFMPRVAMVLIWLLTNWFTLAFKTLLWPVLGFLFMPYTTLVYMLAMVNNNQQITGFWLVLLVVAVLFDMGGQGGSFRRKKK